MNSKAIKRQLLAAIAMVLVAALALGSSTFAWFVQNAQVTATTVSVTATTGYSLLIKGSGENDAFGTTYALDDSVVLRPVSTVGHDSSNATIIGTANTPAFYRNDAWDKQGLATDYKVTQPEETINSTKTDFYYTETVFLQAGQKSNIYIDSASTGIGTVLDGAVTIPTRTLSDGDKALLATMRIGYLVYDKDEKVAGFYVFQVGETEDTGSGTTNKAAYVTTTGGTADGITTAIKAIGTTDVVDNVDFATGSLALLSTVGATGDPTKLATTTGTSVALVTDAEPNTAYRVDIYIWMEGCDFDTTSSNAAVFGADGYTGIDAFQFGFCVGAASST